MKPPPTFNFGLSSNFFFVYRILSMRQKTKNHQNQGSIDKKFDFFPQSPTHIPRWVHLVQKTRAKNSHAWAPLKGLGLQISSLHIAVVISSEAANQRSVIMTISLISNFTYHQVRI